MAATSATKHRDSREAAEVRQSDPAGPFFGLVQPSRGCHDPAMQNTEDCPVARTSEILADRWTPLIVRELILGSRRFNEIERGLPGISRSLLASRLRNLEDAGVIERLPGAQPKVREYHLSDAGRDLKPVVDALGAWGVRWAFGEPKPQELDAGLLVWRMHQRIDRDLLPERRTVVEFEFTGPRGRRVWLVLEPREVSVCVTPPRFDADLVVRAASSSVSGWATWTTTRRADAGP